MKKPPSAVERFAAHQASERLAHVVFQMHRVIQTPGANEIHDLRVSIRRFSHALKAFLPLLPAPAVRKVRKRLKRVMRLTSEARNRDIALEFFDRARVGPLARLRQRAHLERSAFSHYLVADLRRLLARDFAARWRQRLGLHEV